MDLTTSKSKVKEFLALGYGPWFNMSVVILLSVLEFVYYVWISPDWIEFPDTDSYWFTWQTYLGQNDFEVRTPLYTVFIGPWMSAFGYKPGMIPVVCLQELLRIFSLFYVWRICRMSGLTDKWSFWLIVVWLLVPSVFHANYEAKVLTESLSVTLTIFYVYSLLRFINAPSRKLGVWIAVWTYLLVLLRPANLPFYLISMLFFAAMWKLFKVKFSTFSTALLLIIVFIGATIAHEMRGQARYEMGVYTLVSNCNNYYFVRDAGMIKPEYIEDPEIRRQYELYLQTGNIAERTKMEYMCALQIPSEIAFKRIARNAIKAEPEKILPGLCQRMVRVMKFPLIWSWDTEVHPTFNRFIPRFWIAFLAIGWLLLYSLRRYRHYGQKVEGLIGILLSVISIVVMLTTAVGAMYEWGRLCVGVLFINYIAFFSFIQWFYTRIKLIKRDAKQQIR